MIAMRDDRRPLERAAGGDRIQNLAKLEPAALHLIEVDLELIVAARVGRWLTSRELTFAVQDEWAMRQQNMRNNGNITRRRRNHTSNNIYSFPSIAWPQLMEFASMLLVDS